MHHSFDINLAATYGINAAILIHHFQHWIRINKKLNRNNHDGRTWSYQTFDEIAAHFPYFSRDQIRETITLLCEGKTRRSKSEEQLFEPVLKKSNYNNTPFDRTLWYSFVDEDKFLNNSYERANSQNEDSNNSYERASDQIQKSKCPDPKENLPPPIPDTKTDPYPYAKTTTNAARAASVADAPAAVSSDIENLEQQFREKVFERLDALDIPRSEKTWHRKNSTDLAKLAHALDYVTQPGIVFDKGCAATLKWAYTTQPTIELSKSARTQRNHAHAQNLQKERESRGLHDFIAGKEGAEVISANGMICICVRYDDKEYGDKLKKAAIKCKLKP